MPCDRDVWQHPCCLSFQFYFECFLVVQDNETVKKGRTSCLTGFSIAYTKLCQAGKGTHFRKDTGLNHQIRFFHILLDKRSNLSANLEALRLRIPSYFPLKKSTINDTGAQEIQGV
jgi:hypothetical protein